MTLILVAVIAALVVALVIATDTIIRLANVQADLDLYQQAHPFADPDAAPAKPSQRIAGPETEPSSLDLPEEKTVVGWTNRLSSSRYA